MTSLPTTRTVRIAGLVAAPAAVLVSGLIVAQTSYSAFSSTTENTANNWSAGSVELTDDDSGSALFAATDLQPGSTGENCITVSSASSLDEDIRFYAANAGTTNGLSDHLELTVTQGDGGGFGSCAGFTALASNASVYTGTLAELATNSTDYATGLGSWSHDDAASATRTFKIEYRLADTAPNTAQDGTATVDLTWEAQSI
ncbi:hypothetical protein VH571_06310 [Frondihabitans sp. 4ASC-45]|uniref:hypothetical protein n=1 Tax=Frondihabitans sp. 4ASC-45 TaxID=3111636 RepID=UPI003C20E1E3